MRKFTPLDDSINRERLADLAELMRSVHKEQRDFSMAFFRDGEFKEAECNSGGCAVGFSTELAEQWGVSIPRRKTEMFAPSRAFASGAINFTEWTYTALGVHLGGQEFRWLFESDWVTTDNSALGAALRIEIALEHGIPDDLDEQMVGDFDLMYENELRAEISSRIEH